MTFVVAAFDAEGVATASGFPGGQGLSEGSSGPNVAINQGGAFTQLRKGEDSADKLRYGDERVNRVYYGPILVSVLGYEDFGEFASDGAATVAGQSGALAESDGVATAEAESGTPATAEADGVATVTGVAAEEEELMTFIASIDLSNDATADFTEFDSGEYDAYLFVFQNVIPATDAVDLWMRMSTDGGSTFESSYRWTLTQISSSGTDETLDSAGNDGKILIAEGVGSDSGEDGVSGQIWVPGPHLTRRTMAQWLMAFIEGNAFVGVRGGGVVNVADAVDAIRFLFSSGNLESGTITMYGLKNA